MYIYIYNLYIWCFVVVFSTDSKNVQVRSELSQLRSLGRSVSKLNKFTCTLNRQDWFKALESREISGNLITTTCMKKGKSSTHA